MMSNLQHRSFLLITKTRKAREVLNYPRGEKRGKRGGGGEGEAYNQMYVLFTGR